MDASRPAIEQRGAPAAAAKVAGVQLLRRALARALAFWEVWPLLGLGLASALIYLQSAPFTGLPFDDSYISLQFARNLAERGFLTFDGETASAGATSLLHVGLLAVPIKLGADPIKASLGLGVALHLGLVAAIYWLAWTLFHDRLAAALSAFSVGAVGYLLLDALNGMETTLFMLVTAAAAAAFFGARGRGDSRTAPTLAAGVLAALSVLTRPEGVLLLAAMGLYHVLDDERGAPLVSTPTLRRLALLGGPSALALIGLASFYWATTDSFTPGAATAKYLFFREFDHSLVWKSRAIEGGVANFIGPILPWLALSVVAVRRKETLLFAFFWVAFIIIYFALFAGGISHYWYRYQHVFLPPIVVFGSAGAVLLFRGRTFRALDVASAAAVGLVLLAGVAFQYESFRNRYAGEVRVNETRQVGIAEYLNQVVPPDGTIATHDIGTIGYYSDREVIDLVGLVNPDVIDYHDGRRLREYIDRVQPNYIVVYPSWERNFLHLGLLEDPDLFEEVARFGGGIEPFIVYETHYDDLLATEGPARSR